MLLSAAAGDAPAFERHVAHARRWARALAAAGAPPPAAAAARRALVEGLHLMQLLADGRLGDFYAAAEALPPGAGAAPAVALPLRLAGLLAGGAYGRVLAERAALPPALGALRPALDRLTETTVRSAAADAAGAAYERLPLADALAMLALPSAAALEAFVRERGLGWEIGADERGGAVVRMPRAGVGAAGGGGGRARTAVDPAATVAAALRWTAELDRIL